MTTKPLSYRKKVIELMFIAAARHEKEFCELQKTLPTYCWGQLKLRPLSVTLLKEFTRHQLCNLRAQISCHHYFLIFILMLNVYGKTLAEM